jgi:PLP dependent protein
MITDNISSLRKNLPSSVSLMAVTKQRSVPEIQEAVSGGISIIGENYVQEAALKYPLLRNVEKHFIGHLQRNKVRKALEIFDWIDSVDSVGLATEISKRASTPIPILIQVNAGSEEQKIGVWPNEATSLIRKISTLPNIAIKGLQIVTPLPKKPEDSRPYCKEMKKLFDGIREANIPNTSMEVLSMGMTLDYQVAVEEGSTMVRVGEGIFGKRG